MVTERLLQEYLYTTASNYKVLQGARRSDEVVCTFSAVGYVAGDVKTLIPPIPDLDPNKNYHKYISSTRLRLANFSINCLHRVLFFLVSSVLATWQNKHDCTIVC